MWYCVICRFSIVVLIVSIWLGVPMLMVLVVDTEDVYC